MIIHRLAHPLSEARRVEMAVYLEISLTYFRPEAFCCFAKLAVDLNIIAAFFKNFTVERLFHCLTWFSAAAEQEIIAVPVLHDGHALVSIKHDRISTGAIRVDVSRDALAKLRQVGLAVAGELFICSCGIQENSSSVTDQEFA